MVNKLGSGRFYPFLIISPFVAEHSPTRPNDSQETIVSTQSAPRVQAGKKLTSHSSPSLFVFWWMTKEEAAAAAAVREYLFRSFKSCDSNQVIISFVNTGKMTRSRPRPLPLPLPSLPLSLPLPLSLFLLPYTTFGFQRRLSAFHPDMLIR